MIAIIAAAIYYVLCHDTTRMASAMLALCLLADAIRYSLLR